MTPREWTLVRAGQRQRRLEEWEQALAGLDASASDVLGRDGQQAGTMNADKWVALLERTGHRNPDAQA